MMRRGCVINGGSDARKVLLGANDLYDGLFLESENRGTFLNQLQWGAVVRLGR